MLVPPLVVLALNDVAVFLKMSPAVNSLVQHEPSLLVAERRLSSPAQSTASQPDRRPMAEPFCREPGFAADQRSEILISSGMPGPGLEPGRRFRQGILSFAASPRSAAQNAE
jgi:hypothetical protein